MQGKKTVLITGGAGIIGRLLCQRFLNDNHRCIIVDIDEENLKKVVEDFKNKYGEENIDSYLCDFSRRDEVIEVMDKILNKYNFIDILINNAGIVTGKSLLDSSFDEIEKTMFVNAVSHFWTIKKILPLMLAQNKGHIVTISSAAGIIGVPKLSDYCASKFAAFGIDESLRMELFKIKSKVRTTVVCPYYINTGMFNGVRTKFPVLLPIYEPEIAVEKIYKGIKKGKTRVIFPFLVYFTWLLRLFPTSFFDLIANFLGIHSSMDNFVGKKNK
ncbi:MAG: SDR family oxidoreductase [Exilispira sp.]